MKPLTAIMALAGAALLLEAFHRQSVELRTARGLRLIGLDEFIADQRARRATEAEAAKPS